MSKRAYWIVRPEGAKEDFDHYLYLTKKEAYAAAERMVIFGANKVYVDRCYRQTIAIAS
jgi:hypothetical protein